MISIMGINMKTILNDYFDDLEYLDTQTYENLSVIGIGGKPNSNVDLLPLKKGLDLGLVTISELPDASVGTIHVVNEAVTPLLILDGEELIGAKQNRIANSTYIIPPNSEMDIPVSCTEEGRWYFITDNFDYSDHFATVNVRRAKSEDVSKSLKNNGTYSSNQSRVWSEINSISEKLNVKSGTDALRDMYEFNRKKISQYQKHFPLQENQIGSIFFINNKIVGFEILYNHNLYKNFHNKFVESYIPSAISQAEGHFDDADYSSLLNEFNQDMLDSEFESSESVGLNKDLRVDNSKITGYMTLLDNNLISSSFFRKVKS